MPRGSVALPGRLQGQRNRALLPLLLKKELDKRELLPLRTPEAEGPSPVGSGHCSLVTGDTFGLFWGRQWRNFGWLREDSNL